MQRSRSGIRYRIGERDGESPRHEGIPIDADAGRRHPRGLQLGAALQDEKMGIAGKSEQGRSLARPQPNQLRSVADLWILIEDFHVHPLRPPLARVAYQKV